MGRVEVVSIEHLRGKLLTEARHHQDVWVKGRDMTFTQDGLMFITNAKGDGDVDVELKHPYSWTDFAFGQFCAFLEIPPDFIRRCPVNGPSGKKGIVDHWKGGVDGKTFLLRLYNLDKPDEKTGAGGYIRGFLTERYSRFDNLELLNVAEPFIKEHQLQIQIGQHTDKSFHMRLLHPKVFDIKTGRPVRPEDQPPPGAHVVNQNSDNHQMGLHVGNSEVGAFNLLGDFVLFRQLCTNGLVVLFDRKHLFTHKHVGIEQHEIRTKLQAALGEMNDRSDSVIEKVEMLAAAKLEQPLNELRRQIKALGGTNDFVTLAFQAYEEEPIPSRFGVVQAITRAAQKLPSIDARFKMEQLAGQILLAA